MQSRDAYEAALEFIRDGNLDRAERALLESMRGGVTAEAARALERVVAMKVIYLLSTGQPGDAHRAATHYLNRFPKSALLQGAFASLMSEKAAASGSAKGRLILGAGTGRSGSTSLTLLLQAQDHSYFSHEHPPRLSWTDADTRLAFHIARLHALEGAYRIFGDVSHWWLPHMEAVLAEFPDARCIVLRRDADETVDSFVRIKGGDGEGAINHWIEHDGSFWRRNAWDECYPKYPTTSMREAIASYWSTYYELSAELAARYPANVRIFDVGRLSSADGQREILAFAGIAPARFVPDLNANRNTARDGVNMIPAIF